MTKEQNNKYSKIDKLNSLIRDAEIALSEESVSQQKAALKQQAFEKFTSSIMLPNITLEEVQSCSETEIFDLVKQKYTEAGVAATPEEAEKVFLECMKRFRVVGDRNIYGNHCTVFTPPSGFKFNEEVSNTYYHMYNGVLEGSKAFRLWTTFLEKSAKYAIGGGSLNMFKWMIEVAAPVAIKEWEMEQQNEADVLVPTLVYLANQNNQSPLTVAYIFG